MDVLTYGPLRARRFVKTSGTTPKNETAAAPLTVVLMHGYGAPGDDLVGLGGAIDAPPGTTFLFPEAPMALGDAAMMSLLGDARAWWQIDIGRYQRAIMQGTLETIVDEVPDGMKEAREQLVEMLDVYERETKTPKERIVLGGFSQGSMLATDVALRTKRPLAGLVVLSGTLLAADEWLPLMKDRKDLRVFQSHGTQDPILPFAIAERLRHAFDEAGMRVSFTQFNGGHGIPPEVMRDLGTWLKTT
ncbi:MAG: Phospholipase/carboxylesterase family protein [Myxococcaceae bacterium]|jgi:phospholipase/carboxylesterase|nr:Phospholipase/carboxylesterase family protein [Myxococcaceae bacterium]